MCEKCGAVYCEMAADAELKGKFKAIVEEVKRVGQY